jgi:DNA-directed RNA polymerase specialized sigma24 family protein
MVCSFDEQKLAGGDANEWNELVRFFDPILRRVVGRGKIFINDADDIVQTLWMELWEKRLRLKNIEIIEAYLRKAVKYKACSHIRFNRNKDELMILDTETIDQIGGSFSRDTTWRIFFEDFVESVLTFSGSLTTRQREVFYMMLSEPEISAEEISRRMNCTESNTFRCRKAVRDSINNAFDYEEVRRDFADI